MAKKKQWGILVDADDWMSDGHWKDANGDWHEYPALYDTTKEARDDAKLFSKGSKTVYSAKEYWKSQENP